MSELKIPNYKFKEDELLAEFAEYIDKTYEQHYGDGKIQATEDIIDDGHGTGFCIGNAKKYLKRYGKKGTNSDARKDLIKTLHYTLIQLYVHDTISTSEPAVAWEYGEDAYAFDPNVNPNVTENTIKSIDDATAEEWDKVSASVGVRTAIQPPYKNQVPRMSDIESRGMTDTEYTEYTRDRRKLEEAGRKLAGTLSGVDREDLDGAWVYRPHRRGGPFVTGGYQPTTSGAKPNPPPKKP